MDEIVLTLDGELGYGFEQIERELIEAGIDIEKLLEEDENE